MRLLRSALAVVIGYAAMIAGAWIGQEAVYPGTEYGDPLLQLLTVGILTSVLAGTGGVVTAMLAPSRPFLHLLPMAVLISIETVVLYITGRVTGPLWFELLAAASLIAGTVVGAWIAVLLKDRLWNGSSRPAAAS